MFFGGVKKRGFQPEKRVYGLPLYVKRCNACGRKNGDFLFRIFAKIIKERRFPRACFPREQHIARGVFQAMQGLGKFCRGGEIL